MINLSPLRSLLFCPGTRLDRVDKALATKADAVIIDLEDAVPLAAKTETRAAVGEKVAATPGKRLMVRVNGLGTGFFRDDLGAVINPNLTAVVVPMLESAEDILVANQAFIEAEKKAGLEPGRIPMIGQIETAKGIRDAGLITAVKTEPERLVTVTLGAADYTLDLGISLSREGTELHHPRSVLAVACRAARLQPPIDSPYMIDLKDLELLEADANRAKTLGFQGKLCIHPNQIEIVNRIFSPSPREVEFAKKAVAAFEQAEAEGSAAIQVDGKFVDYPVVERSRRIVALAESLDLE